MRNLALFVFLALLIAAVPAVAQKGDFTCPEPGFEYGGYCWVKAPTWGTSHADACATIGLPPTAQLVNVGWDSTALSTISSGLGYTSIGDYADSAHSMWCNDQTDQCGTHGFGDPFENYGGYGDTAWIPVYTCLGAAVVREPDIPAAGPLGLAALALLIAVAGFVAIRRGH